MSLHEAISEAVKQQDVVDSNVQHIVRLCAGMVRIACRNGTLSYGTADALRRLKRELQDFDARTGTWTR